MRRRRSMTRSTQAQQSPPSRRGERHVHRSSSDPGGIHDISTQRRGIAEPLMVYWQPGCTGCLRMKEFLTRHGVEYVSINVLENDEGREELIRLAGRRIPIARRGDAWA